MPIRPENRARYPKNWPAIRDSILRRALWRCEWPGCTALHRDVGWWRGEVFVPMGRPLPITYQYDTRKPTAKVVPYRTGFAIDGFYPPDGGDRPVFIRWSDVAAVWPTALAERRAKVTP